MKTATFALTVFALVISSVKGLPNCEKETNDHCLGEDADFSQEGIKNCIAAVTDKSKDCLQYLDLMEKCADDLEGNGACASDNANGDAMPCLLQRVDAAKLSAGCQAALPAKEEAKGLRGKFWKDGKRELTQEEQAELEGEDVQVYKRWWKRKQKKGRKSSDKSYAILMQRRAKTRKLIVFKTASTMAEVLGEKVLKARKVKKFGAKLIKKECKRYLKKDKQMNFNADDRAEMLKEAIKAAKTQIRNQKKQDL